jgi:hypothetical protein
MDQTAELFSDLDMHMVGSSDGEVKQGAITRGCDMKYANLGIKI